MKDHAPAGPVDLAGEWALVEGGGRLSASMRVPGDVHSALFAAGLIPDPYYGRNEHDVRWVADREWSLSRSFGAEGGPHLLVIDGLDTAATVQLNGTIVLESCSAFREHVAAVEALPGENRIEILFRSNARLANDLQAQQPFRIPYHAGNCPIPNGNMLRRPQCDFGWDWNIALAPVGLTGRIGLAGPEGAFRDVTVEQVHVGGGVTVAVCVTVHGVHAATVPWRISLGDAEIAGDAPVQGGRASVTGTLTLADPAVWWPAGMGPQPIHDLCICVGGLTRTVKLALRDIRLVSEADAAGRSFLLSVNGRPVFARGTNWVPADATPGRITAEKTRALLQSAADANMNMIRVWGGGRYEPASFYEACDELGLLVWQDFMFACHLYRCDEAFLAEVAAEVESQARRIGHHVALWCGDNELLGALDWFEESRANRDRYLVAYDRLNRTIERTLRDTLGAANWWPSSPSPGPLSFGDGWHHDGAGDKHFWSVWHEGRDFEHYRDVAPRFCSEFGFQSYPSMEVIRSFAGPEDWNIASPVMESHQKNAGGNARIAETMFRYFRFPKDFESFVYLSQVQQGLAIQTAVDHWRSLKPHCMGTLYWQLNDTWPCASWSSLDYGGGWKLLHHLARRFYAPLRVMVVPQEGAFELRAVNDRPGTATVALDVLAVDTAGATRHLASATRRVPPDRATEMLCVPADALNREEMLLYRWSDGAGDGGREHFAPHPYKSYALRRPDIMAELRPAADGWEIGLSADALALFVSIEAEGGRPSDNCVTLVPGEVRTLYLRTREAAPKLKLRDLYGATH